MGVFLSLVQTHSNETETFMSLKMPESGFVAPQAEETDAIFLPRVDVVLRADENGLSGKASVEASEEEGQPVLLIIQGDSMRTAYAGLRVRTLMKRGAPPVEKVLYPTRKDHKNALEVLVVDPPPEK